MYVAPVVWPLSIVSEKYGNEVVLLYAIYPMVGVIEGFRSSLLIITKCLGFDFNWLLYLLQ